jgi:hypothetical protein
MFQLAHGHLCKHYFLYFAFFGHEFLTGCMNRYPLAFVGVRDGLLDLMNVEAKDRTNSKLNKLTVGILSVVTFFALKVKDLSFVLSFGGATLGNALIYVYPALMFRGAVRKMGDKASNALKREVNVAMASAGLGVTMGVIGTKMALKSLFA